jgi:hypothetical protein
MKKPLTPNQVVAYNLLKARELRGWTQTQAAVRLAPHIGVEWSKASYSSAERSFERSERIRDFGADEIVAFAEAFALPIAWFFLPPEGEPGTEYQITGLDEDDGVERLVDLVFPPETQRQELEDRLNYIVQQRPFQRASYLRSAFENYLETPVNVRKRRQAEDLERVATLFDEIAGQAKLVANSTLSATAVVTPAADRKSRMGSQGGENVYGGEEVDSAKHK